MQFTDWETRFEERLRRNDKLPPSHDISHIKRVVENAKRIALKEGANLGVVLPSAWLHDLVTLEKNDPARWKASTLAAVEAIRFLEEVHYGQGSLEEIHHCIVAHSFKIGRAHV